MSSVKDDHLESEDHNVRELVEIDFSEDVLSKSDLHHGEDSKDLSLGNHLNHDTVVCTPAEEHSCLPADLEINQAGLDGELFGNLWKMQKKVKEYFPR